MSERPKTEQQSISKRRKLSDSRARHEHPAITKKKIRKKHHSKQNCLFTEKNKDFFFFVILSFLKKFQSQMVLRHCHPTLPQCYPGGREALPLSEVSGKIPAPFGPRISSSLGKTLNAEAAEMADGRRLLFQQCLNAC